MLEYLGVSTVRVRHVVLRSGLRYQTACPTQAAWFVTIINTLDTTVDCSTDIAKVFDPALDKAPSGLQTIA